MMLQKAIPYLFAFTLFLSATLIFSVQPMIGKMMLPFVGGSPSGWAVTMFFFQTCLLFGYGLAYMFSKLPPFINALAILFVFLPSALFLPIIYQSNVEGTITASAIFFQLVLTLAVPFLALSTLAPGLQRLFSFSGHETAGDPYYLYAASNAGSLIGLLSYPILVEPLLGLKMQSHIWMILYAALFLCVLICFIAVAFKNKNLLRAKVGTANEPSLPDQDMMPLTWKRRFTWLALAAIPSSLILGVTTEITTDIASAPMIWVLPLGLYLITNIYAFAKRGQIDTTKFSMLHIIAVTLVTAHIALDRTFNHSTGMAIFITLLYLSTMTITALTLHSRLANDRPSPKYLTEFYLIMAFGGAVGGGFNAFIAPLIFNDVYEFHAVIILSLLLTPLFKVPLTAAMKPLILPLLGFMGFLTVMLLAFDDYDNFILIFMTLTLFVALIHPKILFSVSAIILVALMFNTQNYISIERNFFGVSKIYDHALDKAGDLKIRIFTHGSTLHGFQAKDENYAYEPSAYYGEDGPAGDIMRLATPQKIAVLGLGTGQLACYTAPKREYTFYEIDPHVVHAALTHFDVLEKCGYKDIIVGDARIELAKSTQTFDVIFVDTYSSDAIPLHLITVEALNEYSNKLTENGILAVNISNRHLDLRHPLSATAKASGFEFRSKKYIQDKTKPYQLSSEWVLFTRNTALMPQLDKLDWQVVETTQKPWTDDYTNYLSALKFFNVETKPSTDVQNTKQKEK